jgi:hypothetical protein
MVAGPLIAYCLLLLCAAKARVDRNPRLIGNLLAARAVEAAKRLGDFAELK